jgi:hypothetical protein
MNENIKAKMKADRKAKSRLLGKRKVENKKVNGGNKLCYREKLVLFMKYFEITCEVEGRRRFNEFCLSEKKSKVPSKYRFGIQSVFRG